MNVKQNLPQHPLLISIMSVLINLIGISGRVFPSVIPGGLQISLPDTLIDIKNTGASITTSKLQLSYFVMMLV